MRKKIMSILSLMCVMGTLHGMDKFKLNKEKKQESVDPNTIKSMQDVERMRQEKLNFRNRQRKFTDEHNQDTKIVDQK